MGFVQFLGFGGGGRGSFGESASLSGGGPWLSDSGELAALRGAGDAEGPLRGRLAHGSCANLGGSCIAPSARRSWPLATGTNLTRRELALQTPASLHLGGHKLVLLGCLPSDVHLDFDNILSFGAQLRILAINGEHAHLGVLEYNVLHVS